MRALHLLLLTPARAVSPIQKVVQLLSDMKEKADAELKAEQVESATFAQNCEDTKGRLQKEIGQLNDAISDENAKITKAEAASDGLAAEIAALTEEGRLDSADLKAAEHVRKLETTDFTATQQDYAESLDALARAITLLSSKQVTKGEVVALQTSLMQMKSTSKLSARALTGVLDRLKQTPQGKNYGYQSAMDGVITMLEDLQAKFKDEMQALVSEETTAKQAFEVLKSGLVRKMKDDKDTMKRKSDSKGEAEALGATAEGEKASLTDELKATKSDYRETSSSCSRNNALYAKQDKLRTEEIAAIQQAIDIMQSSSVGNAASNIKYHGEDAAESFIQLGGQSDSLAKEKVVSLLSTKSTEFKSRILSALSVRVHASPFKKVLKMIRDMVSKLQEQAVKEAEAHGWCEAKKAETSIDLEDKQGSQTKLMIEQESLTAHRDQLTTEVSNLEKEIANLSRDRGVATKERAANKAENTKVIAESIEGQKAVAQAVQVLNEFYSKGAEHSGSDSGEGAVTDVYGGQQAQGKGVVDILKVIESDFAREEAQRTASEAQQADAYKKLMNSSEVDVEVKKSTKQHKGKVLIDTKKELSRVTNELGDMKEAVEAVQKQMEDLTKQCSAQVSFEERQELRQNEIQSLKEALEILKNVP